MAEHRTARALQALLRQQFGGELSRFVQVNPDNTLGWNATVVADPKYLLEMQRRADDIATELRAQFDLGP